MGLFVLEEQLRSSENLPGTGNNCRCGNSTWEALVQLLFHEEGSCTASADAHAQENQAEQEQVSEQSHKAVTEMLC